MHPTDAPGVHLPPVVADPPQLAPCAPAIANASAARPREKRRAVTDPIAPSLREDRRAPASDYRRSGRRLLALGGARNHPPHPPLPPISMGGAASPFACCTASRTSGSSRLSASASPVPRVRMPSAVHAPMPRIFRNASHAASKGSPAAAPGRALRRAPRGRSPAATPLLLVHSGKALEAEERLGPRKRSDRLAIDVDHVPGGASDRLLQARRLRPSGPMGEHEPACARIRREEDGGRNPGRRSEAARRAASPRESPRKVARRSPRETRTCAPTAFTSSEPYTATSMRPPFSESFTPTGRKVPSSGNASLTSLPPTSHERDADMRPHWKSRIADT